jgi:hypothetical protein
MPLPLSHSSRINATIATTSQVNIKVKSIIITITYLDNIINAIPALFVRKRDANPGSIYPRNKTIPRPNSSLGTLVDLIPNYPILVGVLMQAIGSILPILKVILTITMT